MVFAIVSLNAAANFAIGLTLSALLGPAEFGRYATVALAAMNRRPHCSIGFACRRCAFRAMSKAGRASRRSLDAAFLAMMALAVLAVALGALAGFRFGFGLTLLALTPFVRDWRAMRVAITPARSCARAIQAGAFAALYALRQALTFMIVVGVAFWTRDAVSVIAAMAASTLAPVILLGAAMRTPGAALSQASRERLGQFVVYAKPIVASTVIYQLIGLIHARPRSISSARRRPANCRSPPTSACVFSSSSTSCRRSCCFNTR